MTAFETSVFVNCPFDGDYAPLLQAMLFALVYFGFEPRIATESTDSARVRLEKIRDLIHQSKYSIHDISRSRAAEAGEFYRLNMPFELGMDYGCREYAGGAHGGKSILILQETRYRHQVSLSDLAGCDVEVHGGEFGLVIRKVRNWLVAEARLERADGAERVKNAYFDFQSWHYERQLAAGFSEADIRDYPTRELLVAMVDWRAAGRPAHV